MGKAGKTIKAAIDLKNCTGREILNVVLPVHQQELHSLAKIERFIYADGSRRLIVYCSCKMFSSLDATSIAQNFGVELGELYERVFHMGYVDRPQEIQITP